MLKKELEEIILEKNAEISKLCDARNALASALNKKEKEMAELEAKLRKEIEDEKYEEWSKLNDVFLDRFMKEWVKKNLSLYSESCGYYDDYHEEVSLYCNGEKIGDYVTL